MSCTEISSIVAYNNQVPITNRCGEVYCCENLQNFSIHCGTCPQQFNLLSFTLFMKHIKECKTIYFQNIGEHNFASQDICNFTIDNLIKDVLTTSNNIDSGGGEETTVDHFDPLMNLKLEIVMDKDEPQVLNEPQKESSDYMDEDELSLEENTSRKKIESIIDEYQKHPILWDPRMARSSTSTKKKEHYIKITKSFNTKFNMNLTYKQIHQQILTLRQGYKKVLEKNQNSDFTTTERSTKFNPKLWYFEQLSFIQGLSNDIEIELPSLDETNHNLITKQEPCFDDDDNESSDSSSGNQQQQISRKSERESLNNPPIISDLIAQYKQYTFLWDQTSPRYKFNNSRKDAYCKITAYINKKFNKNFTERDVRQQIVNLRSSYRREQRKKNDANDRQSSLWYFSDLSFIDRQANKEENNVIPMEVDVPKNLNDQEDSLIEYEEDDGKEETRAQIRKTEIVLALIDEYKEHPCLYNNNYNFTTTCSPSRGEAMNVILTNINSKFNTNYSDVEIKTRISTLRSTYRRILKTKEDFERLHANNPNQKFQPKWIYFDKMSFIGTSSSDFSVQHASRKRQNQNKKRKQNREVNKASGDEEDKNEFDDESTIDNNYDVDYDVEEKDDPIHHDDNISMDSDDDDGGGGKSNKNYLIDFLPEEEDDGEDKPIKFEHLSDNDEDEHKNPKTRSKNKKHIIAIIEEYKKIPCLWDVKHYTNNSTTRRKALEQIAKNVNTRLKTSYSYKDVSTEIFNLRASYKRVAKRKQVDPTYKPRLWYAERLSFIEAKGQMFNKKNKLKSNNVVLEFIDLYKAAPILWNPNHSMHKVRTERRKAVQHILDVLARDHDCDLTLDEFRYHIRYLQNSYYKTLSQEDADQKNKGDIGTYPPKPFFFDRLSFLEPYAEKSPITLQNLNAEVSEPEEDFSYLFENKPLMSNFIEVYKAHPCLWDINHKEKNNLLAHSKAYDIIMDTFLKYNIILTKEQVLTAIRFLHFSYLKQQKNNDKNLVETPDISTSEPSIWFYDNLSFLRKIKSIKMDKHCSHCDQNFITIAAYEKHRIEIAGDYPYKCTVCNVGFLTRSKFYYHQVTHQEPHKCDQCDFQAYDKHNFTVHMRRHKGVTPFKCEECGKGFVTSTEMNRHMRMHTGERPYMCDTCGKSLTSNSEFLQHKKRHANQRDHKCELCGRAFYTPKTLRDHMALHSNERQHICETCGAAFKRKKTLIQHKALHAEVKKHECKICGKMFAQKAGVYSHMKSHGLMGKS